MIENKLVGAGVSLAILLGCSALSGCVARTHTEVTPVSSMTIGSQAVPPSGVVEHVWEEPMVDVVDVPPGLDPEGHYYRPGHQEVVEIRQGRYQHYRAPAQK